MSKSTKDPPNNVVDFAAAAAKVVSKIKAPGKPPEPAFDSSDDTLVIDPETVGRLSAEFLRMAASLHGRGEQGGDIYMAMILAMVSVLSQYGDPEEIEAKIQATYAHMQAAHEFLKNSGGSR